jgi:hypothetical protein
MPKLPDSESSRQENLFNLRSEKDLSNILLSSIHTYPAQLKHVGSDAYDKSIEAVERFALNCEVDFSNEDLVNQNWDERFFQVVMNELTSIVNEYGVDLGELIVALAEQQASEAKPNSSLYYYICWRFIVRDPGAFEKFLKE